MARGQLELSEYKVQQSYLTAYGLDQISLRHAPISSHFFLNFLPACKQSCRLLVGMQYCWMMGTSIYIEDSLRGIFIRGTRSANDTDWATKCADPL